MESKDLKKYPRVLIIGTTFNRKSGGGITMSNLFQGWPKDQLALASSVNLVAETESSICENFFQLGYNGKLHPFPLNIILPKINCGPVSLTVKAEEKKSLSENAGRFHKIYNIIINILGFLGLINLLYRMKITPEFKKWINEFKPDIIYSQLSTYESIRFVGEVSGTCNVPIALHFMDDWITTMHKPGLLRPYWKRKTETELKKLIDRAEVLMSIGDAMSEEYGRRYNRKFIPFHNPIDTGNWLPFSRNDWSVRDKFNILYAGRVGLGMNNSIVDMSRVVNSLAAEHPEITFEIISPDLQLFAGRIEFGEHVIGTKPLPYSELPGKFSKADVLLLPLDFDKRSIQFLKFSFQTKISEYMITGSPVLVYGPEETSTVKNALKEEWACVVKERDDQQLKNAVLKLLLDPDLRMNLGQKAKKMAEEREDSKTVRDKFRACLLSEMN